MRFLKELYKQKPLQCILAVALLLRLIAAIFAKGYGMHDDHFLVIESSGSFADGYDYNNWLPTSPGNRGPQGHSFFYLGLHYILFVFLNAIGVTSPEVKMYIVRIIHAVYSLSIVYFGYKIAFKYAGQKIANCVAWLLAAFWFMPWLSVRNLVEFQCIPFLLWGTWIYIKKENPSIKTVILSGLIAGIAFSIRFQTMFFLFGFGLALLLLKQYKNAFIWGASTLFIMALMQGGIDFFLWGPFAELQEYIRYNFVAKGEYPQGGFFKYFYLLLGILLPPVSILMFFGFFARWKKYLLLFLPSFAFLLFHSAFANKQERFILTIVPSIIILGVIGWNEIVNKYSKNWLKSFTKISCIIFIVLNALLLPIVSVHYSKKARVETMLYLSKYKNLKSVATVPGVPMMPFFYLGEWPSRYDIEPDNIHTLLHKINPSFVIIPDNIQGKQYMDTIQGYIPAMVFETKIEPNYIDDLLFRINPKNKNETLLIYRNTQIYPTQIK